MRIDIYTDGACKGNPGDGGYSFSIAIYDNAMLLFKKIVSVGVPNTTNNRMELSAVIDGLNTLYDCPPFAEISLKNESDPMYRNIVEINIYSDSQYVCKAINLKWLDKWVVDNFKKIKNPDLWSQMFSIINELKTNRNDLNFIWVKGHGGNEGNEQVDKLASSACGKSGIIIEDTIIVKQ